MSGYANCLRPYANLTMSSGCYRKASGIIYFFVENILRWYTLNKIPFIEKQRVVNEGNQMFFGIHYSENLQNRRRMHC